MIRIAGINIPDNKQILFSLTYIYGIGKYTSKKICNNININIYTKVCNLSDNDLKKLREEIKKYTIEGDLRRIKSLNIKRLIDLGTYRGIRHKKRLPSRGQRTKTNARTCKGPKKLIKK